MTERPSKQLVKEGLAGLAARTNRKRLIPSSTTTLDLTSTLQKFGYATGFDVSKYIEEYYTHHPISSSLEHREELAQRRQLVSESLKSYVTHHYTSFISTSSEITTIETDMLKLNTYLSSFDISLKYLQSQSNQFTYDDKKVQERMKKVEKKEHGGHSGGGGGMNNSNVFNANGTNGNPADLEIEELNEELRSSIYERKFDLALGILERGQEKVRKRVKELEKLQELNEYEAAEQQEERDERREHQHHSSYELNSSINGTSSHHSSHHHHNGVSTSSSAQSTFNLIHLDFLDLRRTLIEMLCSELRALATTTSVIGGKPGQQMSGVGGAGAGGRKRSNAGQQPSSSSSSSSASSLQLSSIISHLLTLHQTKKTLQIFLYQVKSHHIRTSIKQIKFTGDILGYIQEMSRKFFTGIQNTVKEFERYFVLTGVEVPYKDGSSSTNTSELNTTSKYISNPSSLSSYLIRWILHELVNTYHVIFTRQVFNSDSGTFYKLGKCLKYAFQQCKQLEVSVGGGTGGGGSSTGTRKSSIVGLSSPSSYMNSKSSLTLTGLNLSFILSQLFTPSLIDIITKNYRHVENLIHEELNVEQWKVTELFVQEKEKERGEKGSMDAGASVNSGGSSGSVPAGRRRKESAASSAPPAIKKKFALRLTSSAKYLYDVVRNLLRELVPILDHSISNNAELRLELYPTVIQGMISLFESYLLAMAQKLKNGLYELEELQSLSILANSYYLQRDLLQRVGKEFRKQFCVTPGSSSSSSSSSSTSSSLISSHTIPELDQFSLKFHRLYSALRDTFCEKRAHILWPDQELNLMNKLLGGAVNKYANPMDLFNSGNLISISAEWIDFCEIYLPVFRSNVSRCLPGGETELVVCKTLHDFVDGLLEGVWYEEGGSGGGGGGSQKNGSSSSNGNGASSSIFWSSYLFGLGGLQQFLIDLKYFACSCGATLLEGQIDSVKPGGYFNAKSALVLHHLLRMGIDSYCNKIHVTNQVEFIETSLKWTNDIVEKKMRSLLTGKDVTKNGSNCLARVWKDEKEKERIEREKEAELIRQASNTAASVLSPRSAAAASLKSPTSTSSSSSTRLASTATLPPHAHSSSAIAAPRQERRGSGITPDQLALMNSQMSIQAMEERNAKQASTSAAAAAATERKPPTRRKKERDPEESDDDF